ncbi:MAG: stalk domain-containing protein [Clostridia bacterium]|nr:stalk domain-containing protein [Clostridia bacterium]
MKRLLSVFLTALIVLGAMGNFALAAENSNVAAYFPLYGDYQFKDALNDTAQLVPPSDGNAVVGDEYLVLRKNPSAGNPDNTGHLVSDYPSEKITGDQISFSFNAKVDLNQTRTPSADEANKRTIFLYGSSDYAQNCITLRYYHAENMSAVVLVRNGQDAVTAEFERPLADMWHNYSIALDAAGMLTVYVDGEKAAETASGGIGADEIGSDVIRLNRAAASNTINVDSCYRDLRFIRGIVTQQQAKQYTDAIAELTWKELQNQTYVTDGMVVRDAINLPIGGLLSWESEDETAIDPRTGAVTRPEYGEAAQAVKLTMVWNGRKKDYTVTILPVDAGDSVLASFDFDSEEEGCDIEIVGSEKYTASMDGYGQAASVGDGFYIQVKAADGSSIFGGLDAVTISYDSKTANAENAYLIDIENRTDGKKLTISDNGTQLAMAADAVSASGTGTEEWKRVTASFSDSEMKLYINGDLVISEQGTYAVKSVLQGNSVLRIGFGGAGLIDNVRVFNRALSVEEISEYMAANIAPAMNVSGGSETYPIDTFEPITITHPAGNSYIYYTMDGSEPTIQSSRYEGGFHADGVAHIKACAIASNGTKSATVEAYVYSKKWNATAAEFRIEGENTVNNVKIAWPVYPNATKYEVYRGDVLIGTAIGDCLDEHNLEVNKNYQYTVLAYNGDDVIAEGTTNTVTTFAVNLDEITGYDDNVNGGWVPLVTGDPTPSGYNINGKYYRVRTQGVSREEFVEAGFDGAIWDDTCSVTSIRYMESDDGINWPEEYTLVYPIFVDMRLEGAQNGLHYDKETISFSAHAEGTNGYGTAKLFFATFRPGRSADDVQPYGVTVSGGKILAADSPWEQYEVIENPGRNQLSGYYVGRPFGYDSRDMVRFTEGKDMYTFSATAMNQDMLILKLDDDWLKPEKVVQVALKGQHQESPAVFHDGNAYYVYTSTANGWFASQARYASTESLDQPWSPLREIANASTFATQGNGVWGYDSDSGRFVHRGHGYNWGHSGGWRENNYQRFWHMAINDGIATGAWCYRMEYHPYWGAIAVQSGENVSLGKKATAEGNSAPGLTDNLQLQSSPVTEISNLPYDIIVDLEKPTVITEVNLTNDLYIGSACASYFLVYGSNDMSNWTQISDQTGGDYDDPAFRVGWVEDTTPYRYVKVTVTAVRNLQSGGSSALWGGKPLEVAIYGKPEGFVNENYVLPQDEILVGYNRNNIDFEPYGQEPVIVNDRTLVPLRAIFETMGAEVNWDDATRTVTATRGGTTISLAIGSDQLYVNGEAKTIDTPAQLISERTMVPVRAIAESFGCEVDWNAGARRVYIREA